MRTRYLLAAFLACAALPALAQEREWTFDTSDEDAHLVFGVPDSDDAGISFDCALQSGEVTLFIPEAGDELKPDQKTKLVITVAGKDFTYESTTSANEMTATISAEAVLQASDVIFSALAKADRFRVRIGKEEDTFPLEGSDFDSLVRACTKS